MILVDRTMQLTTISKQWREEAAAASEYVRAHRSSPPPKPGTPPRLVTIAEAQSAAIAAHQKLWTREYEIKELLERVSHRKCWYCESREVRSSNDIDHFRPKNGVHGEVHDGYWWLAFDPLNFRYSCEKCNRPRKGTHFPLAGGTRCVGPNDDLAGEQPMLLDPVVSDDVTLLTFLSDGTVLPFSDEDSLPGKRARKSIDLYYLLDADLTEARAEKFALVCELVELAEYLLHRSEEGDTRADALFHKVVKQLNAAISKKAEFSAAGRAALAENQAPWIARLRESGDLE